MLRFHLDFIHVRLHRNIYPVNGKCLDAWVCLCATGTVQPFVGEQGPCRFQFPEVSARPEDGWKLIHQPSQRPYCEASLHTQISWNIWAWIRRYCPSRSSSGWFPDCIHEQQVNFLCSLSETSEPTKLRRTTYACTRHSLYRGVNKQMYAVRKLEPSAHSFEIFTHFHGCAVT